MPESLVPEGALCIVPPVLPELSELPPELLPELPLEAGGAEGAAPGVDGVESGLDGLDGETPGVVLESAGGVTDGGVVDWVEGVLVEPD